MTIRCYTNINLVFRHYSTICLSCLNDKILKDFDQGEITGMILIGLKKVQNK